MGSSFLKPGQEMPKGGPFQFDYTISDPKQRIQAYLDDFVNNESYRGIDRHLMRAIRIISASVQPSPTNTTLSTSIFEIPVIPELCNPMQNMHGGAVATLADMATTMATAPLTKRDFWEFGGVSRTLSVTYLKAMPLGSVLRVECEVRSIGKRLSVTQCLIRDKNTGELVALAEHGKSALQDQQFPIDGGKGGSRL